MIQITKTVGGLQEKFLGSNLEDVKTYLGAKSPTDSITTRIGDRSSIGDTTDIYTVLGGKGDGITDLIGLRTHIGATTDIATAIGGTEIGITSRIGAITNLGYTDPGNNLIPFTRLQQALGASGATSLTTAIGDLGTNLSGQDLQTALGPSGVGVSGKIAAVNAGLGGKGNAQEQITVIENLIGKKGSITGRLDLINTDLGGRGPTTADRIGSSTDLGTGYGDLYTVFGGDATNTDLMSRFGDLSSTFGASTDMYTQLGLIHGAPTATTLIGRLKEISDALTSVAGKKGLVDAIGDPVAFCSRTGETTILGLLNRISGRNDASIMAALMTTEGTWSFTPKS